MLKVEINNEKKIFNVSGGGTVPDLLADLSLIINRIYENLGSDNLRKVFKDGLEMSVMSGMMFAPFKKTTDEVVKTLLKRMREDD